MNPGLQNAFFDTIDAVSNAAGVPGIVKGVLKKSAKKGAGALAKHFGRGAVEEATEQAAHISRRGALRSAKRDAGIPMSQQPSEVRHVEMTDQFGRKIIGRDGKPVRTR